MKRAIAIVSFLVSTAAAGEAQGKWNADATAMLLPEAWDYNESRETLTGIGFGIDREAAGPLRVRVEGLVLRVAQDAGDSWLRGFTVGSRARWKGSRVSPYVDVSVGLSTATTPVPVRGTTFNYLASLGGGIAVPFGGIEFVLGGRWFHVSNNGRDGRDRNPDIQSLGAAVGIGWKHVF